jgi:hypothetical protein
MVGVASSPIAFPDGLITCDLTAQIKVERKERDSNSNGQDAEDVRSMLRNSGDTRGGVAKALLNRDEWSVVKKHEETRQNK